MYLFETFKILKYALCHIFVCVIILCFCGKGKTKTFVCRKFICFHSTGKRPPKALQSWGVGFVKREGGGVGVGVGGGRFVKLLYFIIIC